MNLRISFFFIFLQKRGGMQKLRPRSESRRIMFMHQTPCEKFLHTHKFLTQIRRWQLNAWIWKHFCSQGAFGTPSVSSNIDFSPMAAVLGTGGKPSTWFPPGRLAEQYQKRTWLRRICHPANDARYIGGLPTLDMWPTRRLVFTFWDFSIFQDVQDFSYFIILNWLVYGYRRHRTFNFNWMTRF